MRKIIIAALLGAHAIPAQSQSVAFQEDISYGNGLYAICQSSIEYDRAACWGYVEGVVETQLWRTFCAPQGAKTQQAHDIVRRGLNNHPEERQLASIKLIGKYLGASWPCPKR